MRSVQSKAKEFRISLTGPTILTSSYLDYSFCELGRNRQWFSAEESARSIRIQRLIFRLDIKSVRSWASGCGCGAEQLQKSDALQHNQSLQWVPSHDISGP